MTGQAGRTEAEALPSHLRVANDDPDVGDHDALRVDEDDIRAAAPERLQKDRAVILRAYVDHARIADQDRRKRSLKPEDRPLTRCNRDRVAGSSARPERRQHQGETERASAKVGQQSPLTHGLAPRRYVSALTKMARCFERFVIVHEGRQQHTAFASTMNALRAINFDRHAIGQSDSRARSNEVSRPGTALAPYHALGREPVHMPIGFAAAIFRRRERACNWAILFRRDGIPYGSLRYVRNDA